MKNKILFCVLILLMGFLLSIISINAKNYYSVIIDPGHGGVDPGSIFDDVYEKYLNLEFSTKIKNYLEKSNIKVLMTRYQDYDLSRPNAIYRKKSDFDNRILLINQSKANIYLSIHMNYLLDSNYYGPQLFYDKNNKELAEILQKELNKVSKSSRKIKTIDNSLYMYNKLNIPGVLLEVGFLSNNYDRERLLDNSYQNMIAKTISKTIVKYLN